jgi:hypothetical protein
MKARCRRHRRYRTIKICKQWLKSFSAFLKDMGPRPPGTTLERKNNKLGYCPGNCCWAGYREQNRNRRTTKLLTFNDKTQSMIQWSEELGLPKWLIQQRLASGWSVEDALTAPKRSRGHNYRLVTHQGKTLSITDWAKELGIPRERIYSRLKKGWTEQQALTRQ